ncbi:hypothetical protein MSSIH_3818 [Methanosarcina siciliae HI350]|uniref:DUF1673 domain-containing protein n=1 Tax=Methanosarcina siciliae HI350 TaxID=1434119 RepID=A0A0E3PI50_9EURY|nr:DUF1673 domain-containing protein [Methanosarcina siciliae]AKB34508.1 hypothetical protein MSSIH_3818 [Methanosarcina siciliae HI350]
MNGTGEFIKKFMGWCPNARAHETKKYVDLERFELDTPAGAGGEGGDMKNPERLRKASTRILLYGIFFTSVCFLVLNQTGINPIFLLAGFFTALVHVAFYWKIQMERYDALVKRSVVEHSNKKKNIILTIPYALYFVLFFLSIIVGREHSLQAMISFGTGLMVGIWLGYFQIIYWEKINHVTIYFDKGYGMGKKSYIVRKGE